MLKLKVSYTFFLQFLLLQVSSSWGQMVFPFPNVYPEDLGSTHNTIHLTEYFQYHKSTMAWTRIWFRPAASQNYGNGWMANDPNSRVDFNSILYRTHNEKDGKGVLFHFMANSLNKHDHHLAKLMKVIDVPNNVYTFPVVQGPGEAESTVDFMTFMGHFNGTQMQARFAMRFTEVAEGREGPEGYTQKHIDDMVEYTKPLCADIYTAYMVAFNAYLVGQSAPEVNFNYYANFRRCHLLVYSLPDHPIVNIRRLREALIDHVNLNRMIVLMPGRSITQRLISLENVAWAYALGHRRFPDNELPQNGLLEMLDGKVSIIRLATYKLRDMHDWSPLRENPSYFFRKITEFDLRRQNFDVEYLPYLAQVQDWSQVIILKPENFDEWQDMMKYFLPHEMDFSNSHFPFTETTVLKGPNGPCDALEEQEKFNRALKDMDDNIRRHSRFIFSFCESHGKYTASQMQDLLSLVNKNAELLKDSDWGVMLEISAIGNDPEITKALAQVLDKYECRWVFLKDDMDRLSSKVLEEMVQWWPVMRDKVIILAMNDQVDKVNTIYSFFKRKEPVDTSGVDVTTLTPTTTAVTTTVTTPTPRVLLSTTTMKLEPTPATFKPVVPKSDASDLRSVNSVLGPAAFVAFIMGFLL